MDIVLTGPQGCGKARASEAVLQGMRIAPRDVVTLDMESSVAMLGERFRDARARAIVIEGVTTVEELQKAQDVVERYRRSVKAKVIGIYTSVMPITHPQAMAAVLEVTAPRRVVTSPMSQDSPSGQIHSHSHALLVVLWDRAADVVGQRGAHQMLRMANALVPGCVTKPTEDFIALLSYPQRIQLHQFLTDLISEHE